MNNNFILRCLLFLEMGVLVLIMSGIIALAISAFIFVFYYIVGVFLFGVVMIPMFKIFIVLFVIIFVINIFKEGKGVK